LVPVTAAFPDEPRTAAVIKSYEDRLGNELGIVVTTSRVPLDAATIRLRASETNLGDLVADAMRADAKTDIAIVNSGSIRGDREYPAGPITRRNLIEMYPFGNVVCAVEVTGSIILQALNSGVSKLPASAGQFPQVSGLTMRVSTNAPVGNRVSDVRIGGRPLEPNKTYSVAIPDYMLSGGDEYTMFLNQKVLIGPQAGGVIVTALERFVTGRELTQNADGRISMPR
jgi:2',3'-cyclic-nucleotide 2'-phosphodiesterase (5'-nucleotidase family)